MKHDLVFFEECKVRIHPCHVIVSVQATAVPIPSFEPDLLTQEVQELLEILAGFVVRKELIVCSLSAFGIDHSELEIHGTFLFLQSEQILLQTGIAGLKLK